MCFIYRRRQNRAAGGQFAGCPRLRSGPWSRRADPLHPECGGCRPAGGGEGQPLPPRAPGTPWWMGIVLLAHPQKAPDARTQQFCCEGSYVKLFVVFWYNVYII